jgi:hypothetical protein
VFNTDHKATFRLDTPRSWSPVSFELRSLLEGLPQAELIAIEVQDSGYDYGRLRLRGSRTRHLLFGRALLWFARRRQSLFHRLRLKAAGLNQLFDTLEQRLGKPVAQTDGDAVAQIQAVVRKTIA